MRLSLKTPSIESRYPPIADDDKKKANLFNLTMVNLNDDAQSKALEKKTFFDTHRLNSQFGKDPLVLTPDSFYFRYSIDNHLYYTESATDTIVL